MAVFLGMVMGFLKVDAHIVLEMVDPFQHSTGQTAINHLRLVHRFLRLRVVGADLFQRFLNMRFVIVKQVGESSEIRRIIVCGQGLQSPRQIVELRHHCHLFLRHRRVLWVVLQCFGLNVELVQRPQQGR